MHYHVILRGGDSTRPVKLERFDTLDEAEAAAQLISEKHIQPSWIPTRYPGRPSRMNEVAVYLDRRIITRREVVVLRCDGAEQVTELACSVNRNGEAMLPATYFHRGPDFSRFIL